jgi:cation diffusion facilitator CzcD-associated flavoprotein CzcO
MANPRIGSSSSKVAVIGAGPYGLAATAHLRDAGVETIVFGEPMAFWDQSMPAGMILRSTSRASSISDPHRALTLERYAQAVGKQLPERLTLASFVAYGRWFQEQAARDVDRRRVVRVEPATSGFGLVLDDHERLDVGRVVVAGGIGPFAWRPEQFAGLPPSFVSHSSAIHDVSAFAGRRVLVVGAGQSALEYAALLHESGADIEVVARTPRLRWLRSGSHDASLLSRWGRALLHTPTEVGPPGLNWVVGAPDVFRRMPRIVRPQIELRCNYPVGAGWLPPRMDGITITTGRTVTSAAPHGGRLRITLDDGTYRDVDHAVVATGYRIDVRRYEFLGPEVLRSLSMAGGYPRLATGLEASIRGLHFLGAPSAFTFGPVMRFVTGSWYSARALTRKVLGKPPLPLSFSW